MENLSDMHLTELTPFIYFFIKSKINITIKKILCTVQTSEIGVLFTVQ